MSFSTGTATGVGDLVRQWFDFLQANGWTADVDFVGAAPSPFYGIINRKQDLASPLGSDPLNEVNLQCGYTLHATETTWLNMIPMRGYTSGDPVTGGVEVATAGVNYNSSVHIVTNFPTTPFENFWFFESDFYAHAVVEYASGFYRHFGMGQLSKIGKWFGGEYYYGSFWDQALSQIDSPLSTAHSVILDGATALLDRIGVVYGQLLDKSPFPNAAGLQSPETAWHAAKSSLFGSNGGTDGDGRTRGLLQANSTRKGVHHLLYGIGRSGFNGYRPLFPYTLFAQNATVAPDNYYPIGNIPDVRLLPLSDGLLPKDEFTIGADTWIVFPVSRNKSPTVTDDTEQSLNFGLAYKKVTT
jgi:hypothetical protein